MIYRNCIRKEVFILFIWVVKTTDNRYLGHKNTLTSFSNARIFKSLNEAKKKIESLENRFKFNKGYLTPFHKELMLLTKENLEDALNTNLSFDHSACKVVVNSSLGYFVNSFRKNYRTLNERFSYNMNKAAIYNTVAEAFCHVALEKGITNLMQDAIMNVWVSAKDCNSLVEAEAAFEDLIKFYDTKTLNAEFYI